MLVDVFDPVTPEQYTGCDVEFEALCRSLGLGERNTPWCTKPQRHSCGIYVGPSDIAFMHAAPIIGEWGMAIGDLTDGALGSLYLNATCDHPDQIELYYGAALDSFPREYCVVAQWHLRSKQPPQHGWRWSKWGPYLGKRHRRADYLFDEPEIEAVVSFSVWTKDPKWLPLSAERTATAGGIHPSLSGLAPGLRRRVPQPLVADSVSPLRLPRRAGPRPTQAAPLGFLRQVLPPRPLRAPRVLSLPCCGLWGIFELLTTQGKRLHRQRLRARESVGPPVTPNAS